VFDLNKNERCLDDNYSSFITCLQKMACDDKIDTFGYALVTCMVPLKLMKSTKPTDTRLAATHQEITDYTHEMVTRYEIPESFYYIEASNFKSCEVNGIRQEEGLYLPLSTAEYIQKRRPGKFLPYIPLVIGGSYFVNDRSESNISVLVHVDEEMTFIILQNNKNE
jgi:hypothetical protein